MTIPLLLFSRRSSKQDYYKTLIGLEPLALWMMDESTGSTVSLDATGKYNGAYTSVTLGQDGRFGRTSAGFYAAASRNNVYSANFVNAFNGVAGTIAAWAKINTWTDGVFHRLVYFMVNANYRISIYKHTTNNFISFQYGANATYQTIDNPGMTSLDWKHYAITWDKNAGALGEMKAYVDGDQVGTTQTGLDTWAGTLASGYCNIGCYEASSQPWGGQLQWAGVWMRALSTIELRKIYTG